MDFRGTLTLGLMRPKYIILWQGQITVGRGPTDQKFRVFFLIGLHAPKMATKNMVLSRFCSELHQFNMEPDNDAYEKGISSSRCPFSGPCLT